MKNRISPFTFIKKKLESIKTTEREASHNFNSYKMKFDKQTEKLLRYIRNLFPTSRRK